MTLTAEAIISLFGVLVTVIPILGLLLKAYARRRRGTIRRSGSVENGQNTGQNRGTVSGALTTDADVNVADNVPRVQAQPVPRVILRSMTHPMPGRPFVQSK